MVFIVAGHQVYSPHMWGCFLTFVFQKMSKLVFPTHVGVFPGKSMRCLSLGIPHTCGGEGRCPHMSLLHCVCGMVCVEHKEARGRPR